VQRAWGPSEVAVRPITASPGAVIVTPAH
jgi:hypothetical protein